MRKRLFSILLAQCLVLCLVPTTAFAESETEETPVCTCETACTEETMNAECPICGAEGALAENCGKYVEPAAEGEESQLEGEKTQEKQDSDMPDTQSEATLAQMSGEGENGIAVQSAGVAIDNTNFPDANFRSFVASSFDEDNDNYLSDTEINAAENINCAKKGISDLTGISHFTALKSLKCFNNQLTALDVSKNTALTYLDCRSNQLTALDVSKNTALTYLDCGNNQLTSLDVSKNTALTDLACRNNQLTSLDISNTDMSGLDCDGNIYQIVVGNDRTFDLSTLPGNFNVAKTSDWSGGTVSGNTLTVDSDQDSVTYKYDCGKNRRRTFTLKCVKSADYTKVDEAIKKANALKKDNYKDFTAVETAVKSVVRGKSITEQSEVDAMAKAIEDAIAALQYKDADYIKVDEAIAKANALNKDDYKDFSAVEAAINAVVRDKNITEQSEVDAMAKAIEDAIAALQYKGADYTKVDEAIAKANTLNKDDYKDFTGVEAAVNAVVRDKNITEQSEVDAMAKAIEDAIAALQYKEKPKICKGGKEVKISNGAHEMRIHGKSYGTFTFAWVNDKAGWSIQNADGKYLSFDNGKLVLRDTAYVWKYDAKFYTTTEEKTSSGWGWWGWWGRPSTKVTNWYLVGDGTDLSISKSDTNADVKLYDAMESMEHSFGKWTPAEDGKHTRTCTICGATETGDCTYENGACTVCGALDPENASVSVSATVTKRTSGGGGWWWWNRPTTTTWEARITATGTGVDIDKVEYSDDGKHYLTGTSFTSDTEITKFYIRVTDSKGNVTNWLYENGKVTQK